MINVNQKEKPSKLERILMSIFKYKDIRKEVDGEMSLYMRRFYIFKIKGYAMFIHKIYRSDEDRWLHDHPWPFITVVLKNGYMEELPEWRTEYMFSCKRIFKTVKAISVLRHSATDLHRLHLIGGNPTWSLFMHGKRVRDWGFMTEDGWVSHKEYFLTGSEIDTRKAS